MRPLGVINILRNCSALAKQYRVDKVVPYLYINMI